MDRHWRGRLNETVDNPDSTVITGPNDDSLETFWKTALLRYTGCNLTNQADKRMAIWSVAKLIRDTFKRNDSGDEYGGGLWARQLHEQLAWRVESPLENARLDALQLGSPSWSWASVKGPIHAHERLAPEREYVVESHTGKQINFRVTSKNGDEEPQLEGSGSIDINGYLGSSAIAKDPSSGSYRLVLGDEIEDNISVFPDENLDIPELRLLECYFVILAASRNLKQAFQGSSIDQDRQRSATTYSGIGLVLVSREDYKTRQQAKFDDLQNVKTEMQRRDDTTEEDQKRFNFSFEDCSAWCQKLSKTPSLQETGPHFRRIGALQFESLSTDTWEKIAYGGRTEFWLD